MSNYAQIRSTDISNGNGIGVSIFFSGCDFQCKNCFNQELWDYSYGHEFNEKTIKTIVKLMDKPYITRLSILGGDPLMERNLDDVLNLVNKIRLSFGDTKTIWLYSGYTWNDIWDYGFVTTDIFNREYGGWTTEQIKRQNILKQIDVFVDGQYIDSQRNVTLKWCGSSNQRVVNVQQSLQKGEIILWC